MAADPESTHNRQAMPTAPTRIQVCGHLVVELEGERIEGALPGRQGRLLLAYLILHRDRPVRRDELVDALWAGEVQPGAGDALLRPPLSRLRKALGAGRIEGRGELTLVLPDDATIDWDEAHAALTETRTALAGGDWRRAYERAQAAVDIANRGLLPGLEAGWIDDRRRELEDLRVEALEAIATAGVALGGSELAGAERAARAAIEAAPFRESARVALMEALGAAGNIAEAMRVYDELRTVLREELGTTPGPKVVQLFERLLRAEEDPEAAQFGPPQAAPPKPRAPMRIPTAARLASRNGGPQIVERDDEVAQLTALLDEVAAGDGRVALIEGPGGIGKSRLLAVAHEHADTADMTTLVGRGSEIEREFPFGVVRQLFEPVIADPQRRERAFSGAAEPAQAVFESAAEAGDEPGHAGFAALHGLFWLCVNLSSEAPLLLAIDDLHWVDRPSLRFVAYLTQRLEGLPIVVATSLRTGDAPADAALLAEIVQDPSTVPIRPRPLTEAAVAELVRERLGADADDVFCRACHRATVGNPLLLRQLLTALAADGVTPDASHCHVVREIGQGAVSRSVLLRLERLGRETTEVARAVAVLGESAELPAIAALAGLDEQRVAEASAALARAEILRPERPPGFVHPLVRDAVYHELPLAQRELRHAKAARILADLAAPAERVAAHLLMVPRRGEEWISDLLQGAARDAARKGATDSAVAYLQRALDEPPPPEKRARLLIELGMAEWMTNGPTAAEHLQAGYDLLTDPVERAHAAEVLGRALLFTSNPEAGAKLARDALDALPPGHDDLRDRLHAFVLVAVYFGVVDPAGLSALYDVEPPPEDAPVGKKMLAAVASLVGVYGGRPVDRCAELATAALAGGDLIAADNGLLSTAAVATLTLCDRHEEALAHWDACTADGHRRGSLFAISSIHLWRAFTQLWHGDLAEAKALLTQADSSFSMFGYGEHAEVYQSAFNAWILIEQGDLDAAREALLRGSDFGTHADGLRFWLDTRVQLLVAEGRHEEALEATEELGTRFPHTSRPPASRWRPLKALALDALGRREEALAEARDEVALARDGGTATGLGRALRVLGSIEREDGFAHLWEAVDILAMGGSRIEYAYALWALGRQLRRTGLPEEARGHLAEALEVAEIVGAGAVAALVREEMTEIGVEPTFEAPTGVRALTETERRLAALAAEGRSEREIAQAMFVTPNAIDVQLGGVLRKLGISTREELAPALAAAH
jgi:DNA-binding SARP family transcriptional activator/DNA-binding CsgD family transcriptional regulator